MGRPRVHLGHLRDRGRELLARMAARPDGSPLDLHHLTRHLGLVMKLTGGWHIRRVRYGYAAVPLWSIEALVRLVWFILVCVYTAHCMIYCMEGYTSDNFVMRVSKVLHVVLMSWVLTIPFVYWPGARDQARHFNLWRRFQMRWFRVTGSSLEETYPIFGLVPTGHAVGLVLGSAIAMPLHVYFSPDVPLWFAPMYVFICLSLVGEMMVWCLFNYQVFKVSRCLRRFFQRELKSRRLTVEVLQEYSLLWMRLRDLLLEMVSAWELVWLRWLALVTGSCIISLFIGCTSIETGHYQGATFPSYIAVNLFMFLFIVSAFGDVAEHEVSRGVKLELLRLPLQLLDSKCREQVFHFLRILAASQTRLLLKGCLPVNNSLPFSFTNKALTYIAVLAQFAMTPGQE